MKLVSLVDPPCIIRDCHLYTRRGLLTSPNGSGTIPMWRRWGKRRENKSKTPTEMEQGKSMTLIDVNVPENMASCLNRCPASSAPSWARETCMWVMGEEANSMAAIREPSKILNDGSAPCGNAKSGNLSNSVDDRRGFVIRRLWS